MSYEQSLHMELTEAVLSILRMFLKWGTESPKREIRLQYTKNYYVITIQSLETGIEWLIFRTLEDTKNFKFNECIRGLIKRREKEEKLKPAHLV